MRKIRRIDVRMSGSQAHSQGFETPAQCEAAHDQHDRQIQADQRALTDYGLDHHDCHTNPNLVPFAACPAKLESSWCFSALPASWGFEQLNRLSRTPVASGHGAKKRQRLAENRCVALAAIVAQAWDPRLEGSFGSVLASSAP